MFPCADQEVGRAGAPAQDADPLAEQGVVGHHSRQADDRCLVRAEHRTLERARCGARGARMRGAAEAGEGGGEEGETGAQRDPRQPAATRAASTGDGSGTNRSSEPPLKLEAIVE